MFRRKTTLWTIGAALTIGLTGGLWLRADESAGKDVKAAGQALADAAAPAAPDQAALQKAMEEAGKPGPQHAKMAEMEGEYDVAVEDFSSGAPVTSKGDARFTMILGGRYLAQEFHGQMMGQSFDGYGLTAYDNIKKKYVDVWIDSSSTSVFTSEGDLNDAGDLVLTGKMQMPGQAEMVCHAIAHVIDKDSHTYSMNMVGPDGKDVPMVKITYTRKK